MNLEARNICIRFVKLIPHLLLLDFHMTNFTSIKFNCEKVNSCCNAI